MEPPANDYDELTVKDAKQRVRDGDIDPAAALAYESQHKERVTLLGWLDERVEVDDGPEMVVVAPMRKRRVAGMWIDQDDLYEPVEVERTGRVEAAIEAGDLQVVER